MLRILFSLFISTLLIGCATPVRNAIKNIEVGMTKTDVIDKVGGPNKSRRKNSVDHWTYIYRTGDGDEMAATLIRFKNGEVIDIQPVEAGLNSMDAIKEASTMEEYKRGVEKRKETEATKSKFEDVK